MSTTNCPHCGARQAASDPRSDAVTFKCDSCISGDFYQSDLCRERAAHQKAEAEVNDARANADSWRVQSERFESQLLETSDQLAETRKELEKTQQKLQAARVVVGEQAKKLTAAAARFERLWKMYEQTQIQPPSHEAKEGK